MCLLAVSFQQLSDAPLAIAANREEYFARPSLPPAVRPGPPRVLCGTDARAGGTWLGVNEHGMVVAVTNRRKAAAPHPPRSRGLLCRELLNLDSADAAVEHARRELESGRYDGANFLCADAGRAVVVHGGDVIEFVNLEPGLHLLTNGDVNDDADARQALARKLFAEAALSDAAKFIAAAQRVCSYRTSDNAHSIVLRDALRGTVSSSILALTSDPRAAMFLHAPGPPDRTAYRDESELLKATWKK
jgi:uncharacterized protein with NRDE domain